MSDGMTPTKPCDRSSPGHDGELLFVFGRLRRGGAEAYRMEGAEFLGKATVQGCLYQLSEGPAFVAGELTMPRVTGEVYRLAPEHLGRLDEAAGLDPETRMSRDHRRIRVAAHSVATPGQPWDAWTWEWRGPTNPVHWIESGDWFDVERPGFPDRLPLYPWFTWMGLICLLALPFLLLVNVLAFASPLSGMVPKVAAIGALLAPYASLYALWLAKRRGENDFTFGCLLTASIIASAVITLLLSHGLVSLLRG